MGTSGTTVTPPGGGVNAPGCPRGHHGGLSGCWRGPGPAGRPVHRTHLGADESHLRELPQQAGGPRPLQQDLRVGLGIKRAGRAPLLLSWGNSSASDKAPGHQAGRLPLPAPRWALCPGRGGGNFLPQVCGPPPGGGGQRCPHLYLMLQTAHSWFCSRGSACQACHPRFRATSHLSQALCLHCPLDQSSARDCTWMHPGPSACPHSREARLHGGRSTLTPHPRCLPRPSALGPEDPRNGLGSLTHNRSLPFSHPLTTPQ